MVAALDAGRRRYVYCSEDTHSLQNGDVVESWMTPFEWDASCVDARTAHRWTKEGDRLCDEALDVLFPSSTSSTGVDLLEALLEHVRDNPDCDDAACALYDSLLHAPHDLCASPEEVALADGFFLDYAAQIAQSLVCSLAGGFASPRIVTTLHSVSYLVPTSEKYRVDEPDSPNSKAQNERAYTRMMETFQMVLDVMGCTSSTTHWTRAEGGQGASAGSPVSPGGVGWKSAVRVRMLHGVARRRARARLNLNGNLDFVPVNQLDMSGTLAVFSTVPLICLQRLGLRPSRASSSAYLAVWRQVGFYLGISPDILRAHFSTLEKAEKFFLASIIHIFSPLPAHAHLIPPTLPILRALSNRTHTPASYEYNCALTRHLLGPKLSDHLKIPHTPAAAYLRMRVSLAIQALPCYFARVYPRRGWLLSRRAALREALVAVVEGSGLGMRRTAFRPRELSTNDLDPGVREREKVEVAMGTGAIIVRSFQEVWVEMAVVLVGTALVLFGSTWYAWHRLVG